MLNNVVVQTNKAREPGIKLFCLCNSAKHLREEGVERD